MLKKQLLPICWMLAVILLVFLSYHHALAGPRKDDAATGETHQANLSSPLALFQRVISRADGDRCPMAPSCSHYAATAYKHHNSLTAFILTCDRLLRCGHDEVHLAPRVWIGGRLRALDPVTANTFWWHKP